LSPVQTEVARILQDLEAQTEAFTLRACQEMEVSREDLEKEYAVEQTFINWNRNPEWRLRLVWKHGNNVQGLKVQELMKADLERYVARDHA